MNIIIGASLSVLAILLLIIYFNFLEVKESRAFTSGDYRTAGSGEWSDVSVWEVFDGEDWKQAEVPPPDGVKTILVTNGQKMIVTDEIPVNNLVIDEGSQLSVESNTMTISKFNGGGGITCNGTLILGTAILEGNGDISIGQNAVLLIGSDAGIDKKGTSGNIQLTGKKDFHKDATYVYNGTVRQHSGNGIPLVLKHLIIDNPAGVDIDQNFQVLQELRLNQGVLFTGENTITLGTSVSNTCTLTSENGALSGKVKFWFGPSNIDRILFPVSDGTVTSRLSFQSTLPEYKKGLIELKYRDGIPDDSKKSPFEARQVVVAISQKGFFSVLLSNGSGEAWLQLVKVTDQTDGSQNVTWQITHKGDENANPGKEIPGKPTREKAISNILYGPGVINQQLVIRYFSDYKTAITIQMISSKGQIIGLENLEALPGYNQFVFIPKQQLTPGDYMVHLSNSTEIHTFRIMCNSGESKTTGS